MKILAVSDEECLAFWDYYVPGRLAGYDLILACGDLKASYLTFLATMGRARVLYIHGNHDESYESYPPEGCDCIEDHLVVYNGIRILGLGGCLQYRPGRYQYTERDMRRRIRRLKRVLARSKGVDIVITHSPPRGLGDLDDPAHRGFLALVELLDQYHPQYLLHGHIHLRYNHNIPRELDYGQSRIINVSERYELELPDVPVPKEDKNRLIWKTRHKE